MKQGVFIFLLLFCITGLSAPLTIQPGATQSQRYLPLLKNKRVAAFVNQTSIIGKTNLIDFLLKHHIQVTKIFAPEHGFYGDIDGQIVNSRDKKTKISIISLYGKKLKPTADDLKDVDVLLFDIQDVGVRFYTYIASLQLLMEAAIDNNIPLIILDRPNPNGFYVDGPTLQRKYKSFTGMQPIPLVYGMTMGEYATMLVGEEWLHLKPPKKANQLKLTVIPCVNYSHKSYYEPPIKPSPNLPNIQAIYLYPSIGLFEATALSVGRGTDTPFQVFGHPLLHTKFSFTPMPRPWLKWPLFENKLCYGWDIRGNKQEILKRIDHKIQLKYLMEAYQQFPDKAHFFKGFTYASGNAKLEEQIKQGISEADIRNSWKPDLDHFKQIRKKYLMYADFE